MFIKLIAILNLKFRLDEHMSILLVYGFMWGSEYHIWYMQGKIVFITVLFFYLKLKKKQQGF